MSATFQSSFDVVLHRSFLASGGAAVAWAKAFFLTELVEVPIYRAIVEASWPAAFGASAITHPFVWFFFPWLGDVTSLPMSVTVPLSEIFAWLVEAAFVRRVCGVPVRRALFASAIANGASLTIGLIVRATTGLV